jgi:cyclin-dependent kinase-like
LGALTPF